MDKQNFKKHWDTRGRNGCVGENGYRVFVRGTRDDNVRKYEHRMVMEQFIGRELTKDEYVHHIDGNKLNNDIKNLQIITKIEHSRFHALKRGFGKDRKGKYPTNTLSLKKRLLINKLLEQKITGKQIAKKLKISASVVSNYKLKKQKICQS